MTRKCVLSIVLLMALVFAAIGGCAGAGVGSGGWSSSGSSGPSGPTAWTFMVYLDGDNNLEPYSVFDFNEMEKVGSTADVKVVVQWDRQSTGTAKRYLVVNDSTGAVVSPVVQNLGNTDSSNPATLTAFVQWAMQSYPASRYALVVWDHGAGWKKKAPARAGLFKDICQDVTSGGGYMTEAQMRQALLDVGAPLNVVAFDACLMGTVEVAYDLVGAVGNAAFSEASIWDPGFPYDTILAGLTGNSSMDGSALAVTMAQCFRDYYSNLGFTDQTSSAVDLTKVTAVKTKLDEFAVLARTKLPGLKAELQAIAGATQDFDLVYDDFRDLGDFCDRVIASGTAPADLQAKAAELKTALQDSVLFRWAGADFNNRSYGMTVWLPTRPQYTASSVKYGETQVGQQTQWSLFLNEMLP